LRDEAESHTSIPVTDLGHPIPDNKRCSNKDIVLGIIITALVLTVAGIHGVYLYVSGKTDKQNTTTTTNSPVTMEATPSPTQQIVLQ
jgi:flagellar basal body-associated protein FliL